MSARPLIDVEFLRECFDADFDRGSITWKWRPAHHFASEDSCARWNGQFAGRPAGSLANTQYIAVSLTFRGKRHVLLAHRILWSMRTGDWPASTVDHRNLSRTANGIHNLRLATYAQQSANRPAVRQGLKGAHFDKRTGRFVSQIQVAGKNHFLGRFATEQEANQAYAAAAVRFHGEFAKW